MNPRDTGPGRDDASGRRDPSAGRYEDRPYHDMRSITSRAWGEQPPHEDRFGHDGLSGYGDFREHHDRGHAPRQDARGSHRGRGPRNAVRSDHLIAEEINERLMEDERIDAGQILLMVEDGVVTLTGEVPERRMKHLAEDIADSVRGVRELRNLIRVDRGTDAFGPPGREWRSGHSQKGSGFSSASPGHGAGHQDERTD